MSEAHKQLVKRFLTEVIEGRDARALSELVSPEATFEGPGTGPVVHGRDAFAAEVLAPGARVSVTVLDMVAEGEFVGARWAMTRSLDGDAGDPQPIRGLSIHRIVDGQIVATWTGTREGEEWVN